MKRLTFVLVGAAGPAFAHHEVVATATLLPMAMWFGGIAAAGFAAFWAKHRRK